MATTHDLKSEPTADLVRRLINNIQALLDKQVALVKQELKEDVRRVVGAGKTLGIGVGLLLVGALCLIDGIFLTIEHFTRWGWLAALVCALVLLILGAVIAKQGVAKVKVQPLARTRETLKEDAEWAKHRLTPNGKSSRSEMTSPRPS